MSESRILSGVILIVIAMIVFFIEIFIPSGGLLAVGASIALVAGVVMLFYADPTYGLMGVIFALIAIPFLLAVGLKIMPNTLIVRMLTLKSAPPIDKQAEAAAVQALLDATGKALTDLRPVGTCMINAKRTECIAERGMIAAGQPVRVVSADGMQVKVRVDDEV
jgi:membrane-bound serine protease (ClpP class)